MAAFVRSNIFPYDDDIKVADVTNGYLKSRRKKLSGMRLMAKLTTSIQKGMITSISARIIGERVRVPAPDIEFLPATTKRQPNDNQKGVKTPPNTSKDNISKDNINKDIASCTILGKSTQKGREKSYLEIMAETTWTPDLNTKIMRALAVKDCERSMVERFYRYIPHATTWLNGRTRGR